MYYSVDQEVQLDHLERFPVWTARGWRQRRESWFGLDWTFFQVN